MLQCSSQSVKRKRGRPHKNQNMDNPFLPTPVIEATSVLSPGETNYGSVIETANTDEDDICTDTGVDIGSVIS